ncbi:Histone H4 transcription factor-like [Oopsacas minuta]|uniref:Histone H4 transcription factor-like n=1 Tax=Oopsacas minuta TaxID=111878 RepID=A0AAV7K1Q4_9METZ|nr:Histone H4 transcription factor-like [Oopsacas minuta]
MRCQWVVKDKACGMSCLSLSFLNIHLSEHLDQLSLSSPQSQGFIRPRRNLHTYKCPWYKCEFSIDSVDVLRLRLHVYFHAFQLSLQVAGNKYIKKKNLPACHMPPADLSSVIPSLLQPYSCRWNGDRCKQDFHIPADFYQHVWEHGSNAAVDSSKELQCEWAKCKHKTKKRFSLHTHLKMHTQEKVIACPTCGNLFSTNPNLEDHLHRQAPISSLYACDICRKQFSTERLLKAHLHKHINNKQCTLCGFTMLDESHLKRHMLFKHNNERNEVCPHCRKTYKSKDVLDRHMMLSHPTPQVDVTPKRPKPYSCHLCDNKYKISSNLGRHLSRGHEFRCQLIHPKLKRFKFVKHDDGFYRVALNSQLQPMTSVKPLSYRCHICHNRFSYGHLLSKHLMSLHAFSLPPGYSRFRYLRNSEGFHELVTFRIESKILHSED